MRTPVARLYCIRMCLVFDGVHESDRTNEDRPMPCLRGISWMFVIVKAIVSDVATALLTVTVSTCKECPLCRKDSFKGRPENVSRAVHIF